MSATDTTETQKDESLEEFLETLLDREFLTLNIGSNQATIAIYSAMLQELPITAMRDITRYHQRKMCELAKRYIATYEKWEQNLLGEPAIEVVDEMEVNTDDSDTGGD